MARAGAGLGGAGAAAAALASRAPASSRPGCAGVGRVDLTDAQQPRFSWSGTGFVARFSGTGLSIQLTNTGGAVFLFKPVIDGTPSAVISIVTGRHTASIASGLGAGMHTVELYRVGDTALLVLAPLGLSSPAKPLARRSRQFSACPAETECLAVRARAAERVIGALRGAWAVVQVVFEDGLSGWKELRQ